MLSILIIVSHPKKYQNMFGLSWLKYICQLLHMCTQPIANPVLIKIRKRFGFFFFFAPFSSFFSSGCSADTIDYPEIIISNWILRGIFSLLLLKSNSFRLDSFQLFWNKYALSLGCPRFLELPSSLCSQCWWLAFQFQNLAQSTSLPWGIC